MPKAMDRFDEIVKSKEPVSEIDFWNAALDVFNEEIVIPGIVPPIDRI